MEDLSLPSTPTSSSTPAGSRSTGGDNATLPSSSNAPPATTLPSATQSDLDPQSSAAATSLSRRLPPSVPPPTCPANDDGSTTARPGTTTPPKMKRTPSSLLSQVGLGEDEAAGMRPAGRCLYVDPDLIQRSGGRCSMRPPAGRCHQSFWHQSHQSCWHQSHQRMCCWLHPSKNKHACTSSIHVLCLLMDGF